MAEEIPQRKEIEKENSPKNLVSSDYSDLPITLRFPNHISETVSQNIPLSIKTKYTIVEDLFDKIRPNSDKKEKHLYVFYHFLIKENTTGHLYFLKIGMNIIFSPEYANRWSNVKEFNVLKITDHPNIIKVIDRFEHDDFSLLIFVKQKCDLFNCIEFYYAPKESYIPEKMVKKIFQQVYNALKYLLEKNIIYIDLKPENILIQGGLSHHKDLKNPDKKVPDPQYEFTENDTCLLIDMDLHIPTNIKLSGLTEKFGKDKEKYYFTKNITCSQDYIPPEGIFERKWSTKTIVWQLGMLLYILTHNHPPAKAKQLKAIRKQPNRYDRTAYPVQPHVKNSHLKDLINKMLIFNPEERISFAEIEKHEWFNNTASNSFMSNFLPAWFNKELTGWSWGV